MSGEPDQNDPYPVKRPNYLKVFNIFGPMGKGLMTIEADYMAETNGVITFYNIDGHKPIAFVPKTHIVVECHNEK